MVSRLEIKLQDDIVKYLKEERIWHLRYTASTTYGIPDIIGCVNGCFFGIEVKKEDRTGKATLLQKETIKSIRVAGGYANVFENLDDVKRFIKDLRDI